MTRFGIGQSVRRTEDARLLLGRGRFVDDIALPRMAHAAVLRAPHAHADILSIDAAEARAASGVLIVATAETIAAEGLDAIPATYKPPGLAFSEAPMPILARGRVRHVGEPVAFIVAETAEEARGAAERVHVEWRARPARTDVARMAEADAPRLHDAAPENRCYRFEAGDADAADAAFAKAARIARVAVRNNRLIINAIEPRAAIGAFEGGRFTLYANSQVPHRLKAVLAENIFKIPDDRVRVLIADVGGGFGAKNQFYPEQALVLWAARALGRPVKWVNTNTDGHIADIQGRDHATEAELAMDAEGRFLAVRVRAKASLGAYVATNGGLIPTLVRAAMTGPYRIGAGHVVVETYFSNTPRTDAYRGAGTPEANYVMERLVEEAARLTGTSPIALRHRNLLTPTELPHTNPTGYAFDVGDFPARLDGALAAMDAGAFETRRAEAAQRGRLRGLGVASVIEAKGGGGFTETSTIRFDGEARARVLSGMMANGQGHQTTFAQIVAGRLGLDLAMIDIVQGDTDAVATGLGTAGSRSLILGGASLWRAIDAAIEKGKAVASDILEAAAADIAFEDGAYRVVGTDRRTRFAEVARKAAGALDSDASFTAPYSFPNGCHAAEVEIDPETGAIALLAYAASHDSGTVVNPMIVEGQLHGGIAQGIGQALMEEAAFDDASGQPLTGSLMDYALPRADDLPALRMSLDGIPTLTNPLGAKGVGETGCTGAPPAVVSAVLDALRPMGVAHIDMPMTPERVWRAIRGAQA